MNVVGITSLQPSVTVQTDSPLTNTPATVQAAQGEIAAAVPQQVPQAQAGTNSQPSGTVQGQPVNPAELQKNVEKLNQLLSANNTKVEVDNREPANEIWLNLVDKTTGEVIQKFPPEGLREFLLSQQPKGLALDTQG